MTWFRAFRDEFGYSNYGEYRTSVTQDTPLAAVIYACVLISIAALIAAAGIRGKEVCEFFVFVFQTFIFLSANASLTGNSVITCTGY